MSVFLISQNVLQQSMQNNAHLKLFVFRDINQCGVLQKLNQERMSFVMYNNI